MVGWPGVEGTFALWMLQMRKACKLLMHDGIEYKATTYIRIV